MGKRTLIIRSNQISPDSRVEKEAAALKEYSNDVKILAWDRRDNHRPSEESIVVFGQTVPIVRCGHKANFGDGLKSLKSYLLFQKDIFKHLIKNRKRYDVIPACDFDTAFTATVANLFLKKKFIFDIFDYIGGEINTRTQKILCGLQNWIINRADATIICTEDRKKQISRSNPKKTVVVHNSPPRIEVANTALKESIKPVKVCYVGILQDYRLLKEIPEFFISHPEFEFHIGGFGKYEALYKELSEKHSNIIFYGSLQYQDTLKLESECDVMLAIYDPALENHIFAAPNKFYEGLMIGKPLIMVKGTGMSAIIEQYDLGETIEYSMEGFEQGMLNIAERRNQWPEISERMQSVYNLFSWDEMKLRLKALYETI